MSDAKTPGGPVEMTNVALPPPAYPQPQNSQPSFPGIPGPQGSSPAPIDHQTSSHPQQHQEHKGQAPSPYPPNFQAPQYQAPAPTLTPAQIGEQYRSELYAKCAQGQHERTTKYGVCGIITAVVCFPIGLICLFMDTDEVCNRCGVRLAD